MERLPNRRRRNLVDRKFQLGLAWRMMFAFLLFFLGGIVIVFAPSMYRLATGSSLSELEPASREFLVLHERIWPAALFIFGGVFAYTLYFSRRIAGPIHRINETLRKMVDGEFPETVIFRRGDFFHPTAELLETLSRKASGKAGQGAPREDDPAGPVAK